MTDESTSKEPEEKRRWRFQRETSTTTRRFPEKYFRQWRQHRNMSLEDAAAAISQYLREMEYASGYRGPSLGRLERGRLPYSQPVMEAMAVVYQTTEEALLCCDPRNPTADILSIWNRLPPASRLELVEIARTLAKRRA